MNEDSGSATRQTSGGNDSPSSVTTEAPISDSQDQMMTNENIGTCELSEKERKLRRINRRKALAIERSPLPPPKLGRITSANNTIDLTTEDDDPTNKWFEKTFKVPVITKNKSPESSKPFAVPQNFSKNAPRSLLIRDTLKKKLEASMSLRRRREQEQRRKMYEEDNEHLKPPSDEEEEEVGEIVRKKRKVKKPKPSNLEDDYNSEDDEDYKEEDSPPENSSDEEVEKDEDKKNEAVPSEEIGRADDEMSVNFLDDSFTYDVFNHKKRHGPGSTVSSFDTRSQGGDVEKNTLHQSLIGGSDDFGDLLNLCSGTFGGSQAASNGDSLPDTLQMLMGDAIPSKKPNVQVLKKEAIPGDSDEEEEVGSMMKKTKPVRSNRVLDSDEEEEVVEKAAEENTPDAKSQDVFEDTPEEKTSETKRILVSGDEESETEDEKDGGEEEDVAEDEDVEETEEPEELEDAEEPNFDDEDDELAVIKRIEHQEYKKNIKKKTYFDDEASLSGDDVGSDVEEEDAANEYEAEEGDADDVPDNDTIRRQNHKLLLKQESDREQRALAKLQDRLLADGDLGGVETNRQFRFKLREEMETNLVEGTGNEEEEEDDDADDDEESKKERAQMIKFKIEHADELMKMDEVDEDDFMFERASRSMKMGETTVVETTEEITIKTRVGKPSLLSKTTLAASFQEVLTGGVGGPKQMYVRSFNGPSEASAVASSSRLSTGAVKRNRQSPDLSEAKRKRQSKLSALE